MISTPIVSGEPGHAPQRPRRARLKDHETAAEHRKKPDVTIWNVTPAAK
jgi:hypothetical protein